MFLTVIVEIYTTECIGILCAELEDVSDFNASCHAELTLAALGADIAGLRICDISDLISFEISADVNVLEVIDYEVLHACNFRVNNDVYLLLEVNRACKTDLCACDHLNVSESSELHLCCIVKIAELCLVDVSVTSAHGSNELAVNVVKDSLYESLRSAVQITAKLFNSLNVRCVDLLDSEFFCCFSLASCPACLLLVCSIAALVAEADSILTDFTLNHELL